MKKFITFWVAALLLSLTVFNIYCKQKAKRPTKPQTAQILAVFLKPDSTDANYDILWRVIKDSIMVDTNNVTRNEVYVDTMYYLERRDTVKVNGVPSLDSLGRILTRPLFVYLPKTSVWDSQIVVDSARKKFDPFIKKKDSTGTAKK